MKLKTIIACLMGSMIILPLFATAAEPLVAEQLAAIVGNSPIMLSDIERTALGVIENRKVLGVATPQTPREEAFELLLTQRLLAQQAQADSLDKDMDRSMMMINVEKQVERMIEEAGSVKKLEKQYGKAIFQIKKDIENDVLEGQLAQMMQDEIRRKIKINNYDVVKFFERLPKDSLPMIPPQYVYAQIMRIPPATEERKYKVREQLLEFRQRVLKGEKLAVLARLYSMDMGSKSDGGEMQPQPLQQFVGPFAAALEELKPGQISEIIETEFGFHIAELISRKGDVVHCRHILLKPEFTVEETDRVIHELDSIADQLRQNKMTFAAAALKFSEDSESKQNGGLVYNIRGYNETRELSRATTRFGADEIDVSDYRQLNKMKVGEISNSYASMDLKGNVVYKIIKLEKIVPAHVASLDEDFSILEEVTLMDKQGRELASWIDKAIDKMYVYIAPDYRIQQYERRGWLESCLRTESETVNNKLPQGFNEIKYAYQTQQQADSIDLTDSVTELNKPVIEQIQTPETADQTQDIHKKAKRKQDPADKKNKK